MTTSKEYKRIIERLKKKKCCQTVMNRIVKLNKNIEEGEIIRGYQHRKFFDRPYDTQYVTLASLKRAGKDISILPKEALIKKGKRVYVPYEICIDYYGP